MRLRSAVLIRKRVTLRDRSRKAVRRPPAKPVVLNGESVAGPGRDGGGEPCLEVGLFEGIMAEIFDTSAFVAGASSRNSGMSPFVETSEVIGV